MPMELFQKELYAVLLTSRAGKQWHRLGIHRRAGVAAPLFSMHSHESIGVGEIPDLTLWAEWCHAAGMTIIQRLSLQGVGFDFRPYDAQSSFAVDPMYLSLEKLVGVRLDPHRVSIRALRQNFPPGKHLSYAVKGEK